MPEAIQVLDEQTIDKIAAGEVIERPSSVVKELVENAIDAKATAITVEIKDGGISFIRITDNGQGIPKEQVPTAFLRHATSKIRSVDDLLTIHSLGFRGEALSSIAAVAQVELITKTPSALTGTKYVIEGAKERSLEEIGAPDGTTFLVRNLFYNTPARKKFLKAPQTEAGYISAMMEHLALSHPDVSFQLIINNQPKMHTNGNTNVKDIIFHLYGREIAAGVLPIHYEGELCSIDGYVGKPFIGRGNRNYETYFINGRYIKSRLLAKGIEDAYRNYMMKHQYPFVVLQIQMNTELIDINVHPQKMEIRFSHSEEIYQLLVDEIRKAIEHRDIIQQVPPKEEKQSQKQPPVPQPRRPEPFEKKRLEAVAQAVKKDSPYEKKYEERPVIIEETKPETKLEPRTNVFEQLTIAETADFPKKDGHADFIKEAKRRNYTIIGQLFETYWLLQVENELFIIDQHAAHEKVMYEKLMSQMAKKEFTTQQISPPVLVTLNMQEEELLQKYKEHFTMFGYEIEPFGGREYAIRGIPANLYSIDPKELFVDMLDELSADVGHNTPEKISDRIATMSCKAAVKGNQRLSRREVEQLLEDLMQLENPYNCPHGRPTIIAMTKTEIEKKFKRIV